MTVKPADTRLLADDDHPARDGGAAELGVTWVTGQDVPEALVARLLTDPTLARKIRADLAGDLTQR